VAVQLFNILQFVAVPPGTPGVAQAHGLNVPGRPNVTPDLILPSVGGFTVTADDTDVTVVNNGVEAADIDVWVWHLHTFDRAFGSVATFNLTPQPFVVSPGGVGSGVDSYGVCFGPPVHTTDVYVDGATGNDDNDGLTPATALETIPAVYRKFPILAANGCRVLVHLAANGGAQQTYAAECLLVEGGEPFVNAYAYRGPQMVRFTPTTGPAATTLGVTPAQSVDQSGNPAVGAQRTRLNATGAPGWTVNDLVGRFARVTRGGDLVIFELPITANTAGGVIVDTFGIVGTVAQGDTIEIVEPGALIAGDILGDNFGTTGIRGTSSLDGAITVTSQGCTFERLAFFSPQGFNAIGISFDRCLFQIAAGFLNGDVAFVNCSAMGGLQLDADVQSQPQSRPDSGTSPLDVTPYVTLTSTGGGVFIGFTKAVTATFERPFSSYNAPGPVDGVRVGSISRLDMPDEGSLLGSGNGGVGLRVVDNALARVDKTNNGLAAAVTTITGTGGDVQLTTGAAIAWGTGVGQYAEVAGYNGNFTRRLEVAGGFATGDVSSVNSF
jgi:hypothetical protein